MDLYAHGNLRIWSSYMHLHQRKPTARLTEQKICSLLQKWFKNYHPPLNLSSSSVISTGNSSGALPWFWFLFYRFSSQDRLGFPRRKASALTSIWWLFATACVTTLSQLYCPANAIPPTELPEAHSSSLQPSPTGSIVFPAQICNRYLQAQATGRCIST